MTTIAGGRFQGNQAAAGNAGALGAGGILEITGVEFQHNQAGGNGVRS